MGRRAALLLALCAAGCNRAERAPTYPEGTALAVSGTPIPAAEIEAIERQVRLLYPSRSREFTLQMALDSFLFQREATRHAYADERERARRDAEAAWKRIQAGEDVPALTLRGTAEDLTLFLWATARELEVGQWSGPIERVGAFSIVQLVSRSGFELRESQEELEIRLVDFRYLPPTFSPDDLDAALKSLSLEIVDPSYESAVSQTMRHKMKGASPP